MEKIEAAIGSRLHSAQHGFRSGRSTTTNLVSLVEFLHNSLPGSGQVDAIYLDLAKAFDRVDHNILLQKLRAMGIGGIVLQWISSYLRDRTQRVKVGGATSCSFNVTSGVPQGSHLGPLFFAIFINDLCYELYNCHFLLYADDLKLLRKIFCVRDIGILQRNLHVVERWCSANRMSLGVHKCSIISFTRKASQNTIYGSYDVCGHRLQRTCIVNDLGVVLDSALSFKPHINQVVQKSQAI